MLQDLVDYSESRAILIGVSNYEDQSLPKVPAAQFSLQGMYSVLTDPELCGWPEDRVTVFEDPPVATKLAQRLRRIAEETTGVLLVYFVGHGILSETGELCLAVSETESKDPDLTGLEYERVRRALTGSPARAKMVIMDCCYSGRAIMGLSKTGNQMADVTDVSGVYTLTAADGIAYALPPIGKSEAPLATSFTRALVDSIRLGIAGKSEYLTLNDLYIELRGTLRREGLPEPNQRGSDTVHMLPFTTNRAWIQASTPAREGLSAPVTGLSLVVSEEGVVKLDVANLGRQLADLLICQRTHPLTPLNIESLPPAAGLFALQRNEELVYIGNADKSLPSRLSRLHRKLSGREGLKPQEFSFSHLRIDDELSTIGPQYLILQSLDPSVQPYWNSNGFGNNDGGRRRDKATLSYDHFDALYPIDLYWEMPGIPFLDGSVSWYLEWLREVLPFTFRYDRNSPRTRAIEEEIVNFDGVGGTPDSAFRFLAKLLGRDWQITALSGHVIAYIEHGVHYPGAQCYYFGEKKMRQIPNFR
ncbi:caspase, EACC1-associated type [Streptomyces sp. NPDC002386]